MVLPLTMVDNSDFPPSRLTGPSDSPYDKETVPSAIWEHNDLRVGQLNFYIRTEVEKHPEAFGPGWETFRLQTFPTSTGGRRGRARDRSIR